MTRRILLLFLFGILFSFDSLSAQTQIQLRRARTVGGSSIVIGAPSTSGLPPEIIQQMEAAQAAAGLPTSGPTPASDNGDAAAAQQLDARLKRLDQIKFNRLPSHILETWSKKDFLTKKEREAISDLPPAPPRAMFDSDERFNVAIKKLQYDVTLGNWADVAIFLAAIPETTSSAAAATAAPPGNTPPPANALPMAPNVSSATLIVGNNSTASPRPSTPATSGKSKPETAEEKSEDEKPKKTRAMRVYRKILQALSGSMDRNFPENRTGNRNMDQRAFQSTFLTYADAMAISRMCPAEFSKSDTSIIGRIFRTIVNRNGNKVDMVKLLEADLAAEESVFKKREVAKILFAAGNPLDAGKFLPSIEDAKTEDDYEALNLLSQHFLAVHRDSKITADLDKAWKVTQAILDAADVDPTERKQALQRAVSLSSRVSQELRDAWLQSSFSQSPKRGIEVLGAVGTDVARALVQNPNSPQTRLAALQLQNQAVNALFESEPTEFKPWRQALELMAVNWMREANISFTDDESGRRSNDVRRDPFGNIYYVNDYYNRVRSNPYRINPISTSDVIELIPRIEWLEQLSETLRPSFDVCQAQLYLKVSEEDNALPFIEKIASTYPDRTIELANECLEVWTENHNPNMARQRNTMYMSFYAFETRAESIPLTRSKQVRNLEELSQLIPKLNKIVDGKLDQDKILQAFIACHSTAEVYTVKEIEKVFGQIEDVDTKIFAKLAQRMRSNLATLWRNAKTQKDAKTKRNKKELEAEVLRGYQVARTAVDDGLKRAPDDWSLLCVDAALIHDANNYRTISKSSSTFVEERNKAFARFQEAANKYVEYIADKEEKDFTTQPFETWFYASLGACDVGLIDKTHTRDKRQTKFIKQIIDGMPEKQREWHLARFANLLFSRLRSVQAELKFRYLDAGFEIAGDHEQAKQAKEVHDYYKDLVTEIQLQTELDGSDKIGQEPFGLMISLKHTKQIERESGGFGRYLQNQNSGMSFSYNYGRPTSDYRDKFEEACRSILDEQFELLSITFQDPSVKSEPLPEPGWRTTPYAYLLLKARGPEVDQLPPLRINLDFLDTSGYVILPIESSALLVDASVKPDTRPYENLALTQILDERQAEEGRLLLEIKATATGLVPALSDVVNVDIPGFEVDSVEDQGVAVDQFDDDSDKVKVKSSRNFLVSLTPTDSDIEKSKDDEKLFAFPVPTVETNEVVYQRYVDADLETVAASLNLNETYAKTNYTYWALLTGGGVLAALFLVGLVIALLRSGSSASGHTVEIPDSPSPFFVISMLQDIRSNNGLNANQQAAISDSINRVEQYYFGSGEANGEDAPDLTGLVNKWKSRLKTS